MRTGTGTLRCRATSAEVELRRLIPEEWGLSDSASHSGTGESATRETKPEKPVGCGVVTLSDLSEKLAFFVG